MKNKTLLSEPLGKESLQRYIEIAYKKLKNSVFYDKSNVITRNALVEFEGEDSTKLDEKLKNLTENIFTGSFYESQQENILENINIITLPKHLKEEKYKTDEQRNAPQSNVIFNKHLNENINIKDFQYMINMPIEGHILGVLWILLIGRYLDEDGKMYKHSYGNRLRKSLFKENKDTTYYPGLFEPYFSQYTTWRDNGISIAKEHLDKGDDIIILTMDLQRYYYSVNYQKEEFDKIFDNLAVENGHTKSETSKGKTEGNNTELGEKDLKTEEGNTKFDNLDILQNLHGFIFRVIERYSFKLRSECEGEGLWTTKENGKKTGEEQANNVLPIGFLPSSILANYRLNVLDQQINSRWNPLYYGRYVDDIIIVDKVEKNSELYKLIYKRGTEASKIIKLYLTNCNAKKCEPCINESKRSLFCYNDIEHTKGDSTAKSSTNESKNDSNEQTKKDKDYYYLNHKLFNVSPDVQGDNGNNNTTEIQFNGNVLIKVQNKKVRLFVFNSGSSDMLLSYFQNEILKNSSEFRFLAPADTVNSVGAYCKLFNVNYADSINKISSLKDIAINKFELSKFLGKQMSISLLTKSKKNPNFSELLKLMVDDILLDNYLLWERILEVLVLRQDYANLLLFTRNIVACLQKLAYENKPLSRKAKVCRRDLVRVFYADLCRVMALVWGGKSEKIIKQVCEIFKQVKLENSNTDININFNSNIDTTFDEKAIFSFRKLYCYSRMLNKYMLPLCLESLIDKLHDTFSVMEEPLEKHEQLLLFDFKTNLNLISNTGLAKDAYYYCPTVITPQELNFAMYTAGMNNGEEKIYNDDEDIDKNINKYYALLNYHYDIDANGESKYHFDGDKLEDIISVMSTSAEKEQASSSNDGISKTFVAIKGEGKTTLRVAIANTKISGHDFVDVLQGFYNRKLERYEKLEEILRMAVKEKVDMIVFPECYLPYEWLPRLTKFSATNKITVISGIEIIPRSRAKVEAHQKDIFNLTVAILPYQVNTYSFAHVTFHKKIYFSPEERRLVEQYDHCACEGKTLHMFHWQDVFFSVYCCFEIASIHLRSAFKNYLDLVIAVECNKDVNYFSSVMESLCRDMHCYFLQVNSSDYGDSRLIRPTSSAQMNMMRVKGGRNEAILVEELDVDVLRKIQRKKYDGIKSDRNIFKPTPPGFDISIVDAKLHKRLEKRIKEEFEKQDRKEKKE